MPPKAKKGDAREEKVMLGRFSNNLKLGLVGYPNVGKSLVFNTLSKLHVNSENYPFATIVRRFLVLSPAYRRASRAVTDATRSFDCVLNLLTWLGAKLRSRACTKRGLRLAVQALESGVQSSCLSVAMGHRRHVSGCELTFRATISLSRLHSKYSRMLTCLSAFSTRAGLVKGAHEGAGLGNAFLSHSSLYTTFSGTVLNTRSCR
jgi:50S ribosome-binding GTPase